MLWKKRSKQSKKGDLSKRIRKGTEKIISGWQYYRKIKENEGLTRLTIKEMWKKLPIESKRFYKIQGMGNIRRPKRTSGSFVRKVLNAGAMKTESLSGIVQRDYGWMWHQIN